MRKRGNREGWGKLLKVERKTSFSKKHLGNKVTEIGAPSFGRTGGINGEEGVGARLVGDNE